MTGARRSSLSTGAARVLTPQQAGSKCPPMELDSASGERKR